MHRTLLILTACHFSIFGHLELPESVAQDKASSIKIAAAVATGIAAQSQQPVLPDHLKELKAKTEAELNNQVFLEYCYDGPVPGRTK